MAFTMNPPELPQLGNQPVVLAIAMFSTGPAKQPLFCVGQEQTLWTMGL